jgi:hypothetical protein
MEILAEEALDLLEETGGFDFHDYHEFAERIEHVEAEAGKATKELDSLRKRAKQEAARQG